MGDYTVLLVQYENVPNYEGAKILVYDKPVPKNPKKLNPHFLDNGELAPIARFRPDHAGARMLHMMLHGLIHDGKISIARYNAVYNGIPEEEPKSGIPMRIQMAKIL